MDSHTEPARVWVSGRCYDPSLSRQVRQFALNLVQERLDPGDRFVVVLGHQEQPQTGLNQREVRCGQFQADREVNRGLHLDSSVSPAGAAAQA